jgi:meso-butanediol dehydrogenase/(S,S)-butanediol dehydrogenase/diacetyl reductase
MRRLLGKVAFISGGGTGIGRACALAFAREGAKVAVAGRRSAPLDAVVGEIVAAGGEAQAVRCDVTERASVESAIRSAVERFGGLSTVVNSAGALMAGDAEGTSDDEWHRLIAINLTGTFYVSRATVPELRRGGGGSIINMGSIFGLIAMKQRVAYAASKGGVTLLTKAMALDHAREGIRVNCICPAIVETELIQDLFAKMPDAENVRKMRAEQIPQGRFGRPEEIANLAVFLASDESPWLTGAAIPIDGGLSAG